MFIQEEITKKFIEIQKVLKPKISIEVGAYDADFSKLIINLLDESYAFEASSKIYKKFKNDMGKINYINKAVSDHNGIAKMIIDERFDESDVGHNGIKRVTDKNFAYSFSNIEVEVECTSLNTYFKDIPKTEIVLWIDCEGANREVLLGASELYKNISSIFIETETEEIWEDMWLENDVIKYLEEKGFKLVYKEEAYKNQNNCIFIKDELKDLFIWDI